MHYSSRKWIHTAAAISSVIRYEEFRNIRNCIIDTVFLRECVKTVILFSDS